MNAICEATCKTVYLVTREPGSTRWPVCRNGELTGAFARSKSGAVGLAYHAATREKAGTDRDITVWSEQHGKRKKEWPRVGGK